MASVVVPPMVAAPVWVMEPPAVRLRLPAAVTAGKAIGALSNVSVRFRRLVTPANDGIEALPFTLRRPMSRTFVNVPPNSTAPVKLLACWSKRKSEPATVVARLVVPPTVAGPDWLIDPPAVRVRLPLAFSAGRVIGALSKVSVRLRKLVNPASTGTVAPAFTLRNCTSRTLP